jgi:hypothetical protein
MVALAGRIPVSILLYCPAMKEGFLVVLAVVIVLSEPYCWYAMILGFPATLAKAIVLSEPYC